MKTGAGHKAQGAGRTGLRTRLRPGREGPEARDKDRKTGAGHKAQGARPEAHIIQPSYSDANQRFFQIPWYCWSPISSPEIWLNLL